jgi:tetratricopeptide (TPR) repeat protein
VGKVMLHSGRLARKRGDLRVAEERLRESVRTLAQAGDRSMLCEAQRSLAELLVELGDVDEAERFALAARETVGPGDVVSLSTTKLSLGVVRSAQGHQAEAEALMREAYEELAAGDFRIAEHEAAETLASFLRERGRCEDAAEFDDRASALSGGVAVS